MRTLPRWHLLVTFLDGTEGEVDLEPLVKGKTVLGSVFEPLRNPVFFAKARIELGAVTWPNGADLAPDAMHDEIKEHGRWVVPA